MIETIRNCFDISKVLYSSHAKREMQIDKFGSIKDYEVCEAIHDGKIIEEYPNDKPYPSILIFGETNSKRPLHIVCAYDNEDCQTIIVTVYQPDPNLWVNYQRREK